MNLGLINKLMSVLEASLSKLSRYDEGSLIGSILSFTVNSLKLFLIWNHFGLIDCCFFLVVLIRMFPVRVKTLDRAMLILPEIIWIMYVVK